MNLRKLSLFLALLFAVCISYADALSDFQTSRAINAPHAAVLIVDLKSGEELVSHNPGKSLIPASIMKSVTAASLLEKVGAGYKYSTPVYLTGNIENHILYGNLLIEASADPSINSRHEPKSENFVNEIVKSLQNIGIDSICGDIIIDESRFPGPAINPSWASGDLPHAYGTGTHGFNFEDNASGKRSVSDPAGIFKGRLRAALSSAGISIGGIRYDSMAHKHLLGEHRSATIDEIMRSCMMRSDNQYAEALLRTYGYEAGGSGSTAKGAEKELEFWKHRHAAMDSVKIVDGSGLSRSNRVTARFMTDVLKRMAKNPYYASLFPLAGQEGTLKKFLAGTPLDSYIALKTGSMSGIQCYAGYKLDDDYVPTHAVVVIMNNMSDRAAARREVERLLLRTFIENYENSTESSINSNNED